MDLKDVILSTLAELENGDEKKPSEKDSDQDLSVSLQSDRGDPLPPMAIKPSRSETENAQPSAQERASSEQPVYKTAYKSASFHIEDTPPPPVTSEGEELRFLTSLRERTLVLFEGMQSPNNKNIEAKIDLILNYLEYQLAVIDERIEKFARRT